MTNTHMRLPPKLAAMSDEEWKRYLHRNDQHAPDDILGDGESLRVPMAMMDSVQRDIVPPHVTRSRALHNAGRASSDKRPLASYRDGFPAEVAKVPNLQEPFPKGEIAKGQTGGDPDQGGTTSRPASAEAARAKADEARALQIAQTGTAWKPRPVGSFK